MAFKDFGPKRDFPPRKMYPAKCAECGVDTEVPFEPNPDRPVYCRECWEKRRSERFRR